MRSRPLVRVLLGQPVLEPGQPFEIEVTLRSRSETPTEHVDVTLTSDAHVAIPQGKTSAVKSVAPMPRQTFRWSPGTLVAGERRQRFRFALAPNAPPSFRAAAGWCHVSYVIEVHVAIPFWIDRHAYFALAVAAPPRLPQSGTSALVATDARGPADGHLYIEASLDATQLVAGEELRGDVSFANVSSKRIRRITVAFVLYEHTREPLVASNVVSRHAAVLVSGAPPEGESLPFRFALPATLWPSFDARIFALRWQFEIRADVVLGSDVVLSIPLDVVRPPPGMELPPRSKRALPVGRQRLARLWSIVAQRVGVSYDDAEGAMMATRGAVTMKLAREAFQGTLGIVAHYRYPHLGLDVRLGERGFLDAIATRGRYEPRVKTAKQRFTIVGRERAQLDAFFDDELCAYLATAATAELDDDLAHVRVAGGATSAQLLETITRSALRMLDLLDAAAARIPPPAKMAAHVAAWRAFAATVTGRFETGRVWIHDASLGGFRFELGTVWEPNGVDPIGTIVRVPIDPPLAHAPSVEDATLSAFAREALRVLTERPGFHASAEEMGIFVRDVTPDPQALLPDVEAILSVLRALRGNVAAGPFR